MNYNIEAGVPVPVSRIPFGTMKVGESVTVPFEKRNSAQVVASRMKRATGKVFTVKRDGEQVRIWRIK